MLHKRLDQPPEMPRAWTYFARGVRLRCPECGISPVFTPVRSVRNLFDWFTPLDGCPRCGFAYRREAGYFMLAICAVNYCVICGLGLFVSFLFDWLYPLAAWQYIVFILGPLPVLSFLFARHAKSLFLAIDHYIEPQGRRARPTENP